MIRRIDEMLKLWAQDLYSPIETTSGGSGGGNMIAMLMECKGELIRGTRGSRVLLDESTDIDLIVHKHLPPRLALVVLEHYCNHDSFLSQKLLHCACSSRTYYMRLHEAHEFIQDTGALTARRMETIDDETTAAAQTFIEKQVKADKPFFVWMNTTRMHAYTHVRDSMKGQSGMPGNEYADGMIEHDGDVGKLLKTLDDLNIADNTIVVYTTDNGPNQWSWPDAATTPFRNEKNSNWEGAYRVPAMVRWPDRIKGGEVSNELFSGLDWFPTLLAAAGESDVKNKLLKGWVPTSGGNTFKVHLDGYNQLPYLTGQKPKGERKEFYYFNDDGMLVSMRFDNWKVVFCEQREPGGFTVWSEPFVCLRVPKIFNMRMDPYERADVVSDQYYDWLTKNSYLIAQAVTKSATFLQTFVEYPPSQKPASFSIDQIRAAVDAKITEKMKAASPAK